MPSLKDFENNHNFSTGKKYIDLKSVDAEHSIKNFERDSRFAAIEKPIGAINTETEIEKEEITNPKRGKK